MDFYSCRSQAVVGGVPDKDEILFEFSNSFAQIHPEFADLAAAPLFPCPPKRRAGVVEFRRKLVCRQLAAGIRRKKLAAGSAPAESFAHENTLIDHQAIQPGLADMFGDGVVKLFHCFGIGHTAGSAGQTAINSFLQAVVPLQHTPEPGVGVPQHGVIYVVNKEKVFIGLFAQCYIPGDLFVQAFFVRIGKGVTCQHTVEHNDIYLVPVSPASS